MPVDKHRHDGQAAGKRESGAGESIRARELALTAGELGAAGGQTVIVALLPMLIRRYAHSSFMLGFAVGGEGAFALALPFVVGVAVDRLPPRLAKRFGRHSFFMITAAPIMAGALSLLPFAHGYWFMTGLAFAFFAAHQTYRTPVMTLVVDALPDEKRARAEGARSIYHALGLAYGLVGAGLLFSIWQPLPFLVGSALLVLTTAITVWVEKHVPTGEHQPSKSVRKEIEGLLREIEQKRAAAWLLGANALWDAAISGIRPYIFVFATSVVGVSVATTSIGLVALVVSIAASSAVFGKLGDEHDRARLLAYALALGVLTFAVGFFVRGPWVAAALLAVAGIPAGATMTLFYPLFASVMGRRGSGEYSGLFAVSVGLGRVGAPMLVGAAIDLGSHFMRRTKGYPTIWIVAALFSLAAQLALWRARINEASGGTPRRRGDLRPRTG